MWDHEDVYVWGVTLASSAGEGEAKVSGHPVYVQNSSNELHITIILKDSSPHNFCVRQIVSTTHDSEIYISVIKCSPLKA
jgi:predicted RNA-binding protein with TRAM domain